jgi:ferritin
MFLRGGSSARLAPTLTRPLVQRKSITSKISPGSSISQISLDLQKLLNNQLVIEGNVSHQYLEFASWAQVHGYPGTSQYFYSQSNNERNHFIQLLQFINQRGGVGQIPHLQVKKTHSDASGLGLILELYSKSETHSLSQLNNIINECNLKADHITAEFMGRLSRPPLSLVSSHSKVKVCERSFSSRNDDQRNS